MSKDTAKKILRNAIPIVVVAAFIIPAVIYQNWLIAGVAALGGGFAVYKAWQK